MLWLMQPLIVSDRSTRVKGMH